MTSQHRPENLCYDDDKDMLSLFGVEAINGIADTALFSDRTAHLEGTYFDDTRDSSAHTSTWSRSGAPRKAEVLTCGRGKLLGNQLSFSYVRINYLGAIWLGGFDRRVLKSMDLSKRSFVASINHNHVRDEPPVNSAEDLISPTAWYQKTQICRDHRLKPGKL
jgi:hypothetical protein